MPVRLVPVRLVPVRLVLVGLVLAGCSAPAAATAGAPVVHPTVPTTSPATDPGPGPGTVARVRAAYLTSWDAYAAAVGRGDAGLLDRAFAGPALVLKRREVAALVAAGEAIRVRVVHHAEVTLIDERTAVVTDVIENHMVRVDARTRRALEPDPAGRLTRASTLRREDGTWKVTEAVAL